MTAKTILLAALALPFLMGCGSRSTPDQAPSTLTPEPTSDFRPDEIDRALFEKLALLNQLGARAWDEKFKPAELPVYFVRQDDQSKPLYGYVINYPSRIVPDGLVEVEVDPSLGLPPVYRLDPIPSPTRVIDSLWYATKFDLDGADVFFAKYQRTAGCPNDPLDFWSPMQDGWLRFIGHELFHRFQKDVWSVECCGVDLTLYPMEPENIALIYLENELLVDAVSAGDDSALETALTRFLAVRRRRRQQWGTAVEGDNAMETHEGSAHYLDIRLVELMGYDDTWAAPYTRPLDEMLQEINDRTSYIKSNLAVDRFYFTGAAIGLSLDRLKADWKSGLRLRYRFYNILLERYAGSDLDAILEEAKQTHDYPALLRKAEAAVAIAAKESADGYMGPPPSGIAGCP